jgi:hypothetical protein
MQRDFAVLSQARQLKAITFEPKNGGKRLITVVGPLKAAEYPHYAYFFAITLQALLDSSEHGGGLSLAVWLLVGQGGTL